MTTTGHADAMAHFQAGGNHLQLEWESRSLRMYGKYASSVVAGALMSNRFTHEIHDELPKGLGTLPELLLPAIDQELPASSLPRVPANFEIERSFGSR